MNKKFMVIAAIFILTCISTHSYAGEVRVYDANDQFIGISVDTTSANTYTTFIPALNAYAFLDVSPTSAHIRYCSHTYYDISQTPYFVVPSMLCSSCEGYLKSDSTVETVEVVSKDDYARCSKTDWSYTMNLSPTTEIPIESFPFNFPIATPLRIEYVELMNDFNFDGNMNKHGHREDLSSLNDKHYDDINSYRFTEKHLYAD